MSSAYRNSNKKFVFMLTVGESCGDNRLHTTPAAAAA